MGDGIALIIRKYDCYEVRQLNVANQPTVRNWQLEFSANSMSAKLVFGVKLTDVRWLLVVHF